MAIEDACELMVDLDSAVEKALACGAPAHSVNVEMLLQGYFLVCGISFIWHGVEGNCSGAQTVVTACNSLEFLDLSRSALRARLPSKAWHAWLLTWLALTRLTLERGSVHWRVCKMWGTKLQELDKLLCPGSTTHCAA